MSKSILIIDTPESCSKCPLFSGIYTDMNCRANGRTIDYPFPDKRISDWCPLREIPEKKTDVYYCRNGVLGLNQLSERRFADGYNACISEILKERDENEQWFD